MLNVAVYHLSVPKKYNAEKTQMLQFFAQGVRACGDRVIDVVNYDPVISDVGVIQGWVTDKISSPHLNLRNSVIQQQLTQQRYVATADSNLFLYANTKNSLHYLRYSFNDVFPGTGIYCDSTLDPDRWNSIRQDLGIDLRDYRSNGNHILICLQRNGGWSMGSYSVADWLEQTLVKLRQHTNRPIVVRPHPGDKKAAVYLKPLQAQQSRLRFSLSANNTLEHDLKGCWAVINHNSSPAVAAAIEGYPVFVTDHNRSQCKEIANTDLAMIERPNFPDRTAWIQRLAMSHWKFDELKSGQAWAHMRQFVRGIQ